MTESIRVCEDHGAFSTDHGRCPDCGSRGDRLLTGDRRRRLSKFVSGALRHFPGDIGLELDDRGWSAYEDLLEAVERKYDWARPEHVASVIETDPNGRFERADSDTGDAGSTGLIRASYGHSVDVSLEPTDAPVPDELYHGTAPEALQSIRQSGLQPMARQRVHLSGSREKAHRVGQRRASDPIVLAVDAAAMLEDGRRITRRGRETYTTDEVPPTYLSRLESVA